MTDKCNFTRRDFLRGGLVAGGIAGATMTATGTASANAKMADPAATTARAETDGSRADAGDATPRRLIASAPVLMNPAETSVGVAFAVSADASGWVEYSTSPDMRDATRVFSGDGCVMRVDGRFACIRLRGLSPATRYFYRIGADRIEFENDYKRRNLGPEVDPKIRSFSTLGADAEGSFCVINDTHDRKPIVDMTLAKLAELKPSVIIWNGDARNFYRTYRDAVGTFLRPHPSHPEYAAEAPLFFINGNHDFRGRFGLRLEELMMMRENDERHARFAALGRNFVQRLGDIALIGLDTGEDKQDTNPIQGGITRMKAYRELQTRWLAEAIETPAVKTAKFKVAFCHIPLYDSRANQNPGDVEPDDCDPRYMYPWAAWQRPCAKMWGPLFDKAGVQLVVTAHQHVFRYDPPSGGRTWGHMVGGGPDFIPGKSSSFPTVIEGRVDGGMLRITVHDAGNNRVVRTLTLPPS